MRLTRKSRRPAQLCLAIALIASLGCSSRKAKVAAPDSGAWVDEFVRQGCYDCLLDARKAYDRLAASSAAALARVFEMDLLLALREKELSIDPSATLLHAESLVPRLAALPAGRMLRSSSSSRKMPAAGGCCRQEKTGEQHRLDMARQRLDPFNRRSRG